MRCPLGSRQEAGKRRHGRRFGRGSRMMLGGEHILKARYHMTLVRMLARVSMSVKVAG